MPVNFHESKVHLARQVLGNMAYAEKIGFNGALIRGLSAGTVAALVAAVNALANSVSVHESHKYIPRQMAKALADISRATTAQDVLLTDALVATSRGQASDALALSTFKALFTAVLPAGTVVTDSAGAF